MKGSLGHYPSSGLCLSGEGDLPGDGVFHQLCSHLTTRTVYHIDHSCRKTGVIDRPNEFRGGDGSAAGRFGHKSAARSQARPHLPGEKVHRIIQGVMRAATPTGWRRTRSGRGCGQPFPDVPPALFCIIVQISADDRISVVHFSGAFPAPGSEGGLWTPSSLAPDPRQNAAASLLLAGGLRHRGNAFFAASKAVRPPG